MIFRPFSHRWVGCFIVEGSLPGKYLLRSRRSLVARCLGSSHTYSRLMFGGLGNLMISIFRHQYWMFFRNLSKEQLTKKTRPFEGGNHWKRLIKLHTCSPKTIYASSFGSLVSQSDSVVRKTSGPRMHQLHPGDQADNKLWRIFILDFTLFLFRWCFQDESASVGVKNLVLKMVVFLMNWLFEYENIFT